MLVLVTYDVSTETAKGKKRLRQVAKACVNYGVRVQNSVFECVVNPTENHQLKTELLSIMDEEKDSIRFYYLGKNYCNKVESFGKKDHISVDKPLIL